VAEGERPPEEQAAAEEAEFAARLEEELKRVKISDVLVQTLYTLSSLGYHKLGTEHRDLPQARLAIESLRALLPVLKGEAPAEVVRDFEQVVASQACDKPTVAAADVEHAGAGSDGIGDDRVEAAPPAIVARRHDQASLRISR
jgi:hypothetical protein